MDTLKEGFMGRLSDPFFSRYSVSFLLWNWKTFVVLFSDLAPMAKINLMIEVTSDHGLTGFWGGVLAFVVPGIVSVGYLYLWHPIQMHFKKLLKKHQVEISNAELDETAGLREVQAQITERDGTIKKLNENISSWKKKGDVWQMIHQYAEMVKNGSGDKNLLMNMVIYTKGVEEEAVEGISRHTGLTQNLLNELQRIQTNKGIR